MSGRRRLWQWVLAGALFAGAGCTGTIDGADPGGGGGPPGAGNPPGGGPAPGGPGPGPGPGGGTMPPGGGGTMPPGGGGTMPPGGGGPMTPPPSTSNNCAGITGDVPGKRLMRRLTGPELETTLRAAFGLTPAQLSSLALPPDPAAFNGFTNNTERLTVGPEYAKGALDAARKVASLVTADGTLARLAPCATTGDQACATTFINTYGARLYRRPLTTAERDRYVALFTKVRSRQGDFKTWAYWATLAMAQSPHVIYRSEIGQPMGAGRYKLTPYEVASALSYAFTGGPPTPELTQLAASNALTTPDQIETAARSLVYDAAGKVKPAFRELLIGFADQWLGLSPLANLRKDAVAFPQFTEAVQDALAEETKRFIASVIFDDKGKPADLLTAPYTYVDGTLAKFYGFGTATAPNTFVKAMRPAGWGLGLLAQGSLLSIEANSLTTSPTKRGYMVRTRLLCHEVPPPPPVVAELPEPTEAETTRQRYEVLHVADASCRACHKTMDSIGFGLENLDAVGRYRTKEGRFDIDARGEIINTSAGNITFTGAAELAQAVARLPEVAECVGSFITSHAFGIDHHETACMTRAATDELRTGKIGIADFYVRMARSEHFRTRTP